uniref:Uncharacterized protein n=1 Tax=uncultured bacterium contig00191 TaxID=1181605 RepID=A0A806KH99_9BACT|nr:hypothetical protein [uncultured bacterium contig00191]
MQNISNGEGATRVPGAIGVLLSKPGEACPVNKTHSRFGSQGTLEAPSVL